MNIYVNLAFFSRVGWIQIRFFSVGCIRIQVLDAIKNQMGPQSCICHWKEHKLYREKKTTTKRLLQNEYNTDIYINFSGFWYNVVLTKIVISSVAQGKPPIFK